MSALGQPVLGPSKIRKLQQRFLGEETVAEVLFVFYKLFYWTQMKKITRVRLDYVTILNRILKLNFAINLKQFVLVI